MSKATTVPPAAAAEALRRNGFVWDLDSAKAVLTEAARQVRDLSTLDKYRALEFNVHRALVAIYLRRKKKPPELPQPFDPGMARLLEDQWRRESPLIEAPPIDLDDVDLAILDAMREALTCTTAQLEGCRGILCGSRRILERLKRMVNKGLVFRQNRNRWSITSSGLRRLAAK